MNDAAESVKFTTRGQVVIPLHLRKQFHIQDGTRAVVTATPEGILLKPVTAVTIRRLRGMLKRKPGAKPLSQEWVEHKREERELEESKTCPPRKSFFDSYALLTLLRDEPGAETVSQLLENEISPST